MRRSAAEPTDADKRAVAFAAVDRYVRDGMCLGMGTGTTARWAVDRLANKLVAALGAFPLPVEVVPFALPYVHKTIGALCEEIARRRLPNGEPFVTDNGNAILDCRFGRIGEPGTLDRRLKAIHGVVATGLFVDIASAVLSGGAAGIRELERGD